MAACTTTYYEAGMSLSARATERNAELLTQQLFKRRRVRTPEIFFPKQFDNLRLVKAADPVRAREMRIFSAAVVLLFSLVMIYGLQHFYAIESSYRVESEKQTVEQLREENRQLLLAEAELTRPERIDQMAQEMGLVAPEPGQIVHPMAAADSGAPALAQVAIPVAKR